MIKTQEKVIAGHTILVTQYPGRKALTYKARIVKLMGSSIARLFSEGKQFSFDTFTPAVDELLEKLYPEDFTAFVLDLLQSTRIDGKEISSQVFDMEFAGDLPLMYKILWFTLEVNYGSFFGEAGIGKILTKIKDIQTPADLKETATQKELKKSSKR
jgi:hypothetical protein